LKCHHRSTLNKQAVCYSDTFIINQNSRRHTPNDRTFLSHCPLTPAFASCHTSTWPCRAGPTAVTRPGSSLPQFTLISPALSRCSETETVRPACQQFSKWHCQCRFSSRTQKLYPSFSKAFARPSWGSSCQMNLYLGRMQRTRNSSDGVVTRQWAGQQRNRTSSPNRGQSCFSSPWRLERLWPHPAFYPVGDRDVAMEVKNAWSLFRAPHTP